MIQSQKIDNLESQEDSCRKCYCEWLDEQTQQVARSGKMKHYDRTFNRSLTLIHCNFPVVKQCSSRGMAGQLELKHALTQVYQNGPLADE